MKSWQPALLSFATLVAGLAIGFSWSPRPAPPVLGAGLPTRGPEELLEEHRRELTGLRRELDIVSGRVHALEAELYGHPLSWAEAELRLDTLPETAFREGLIRSSRRCRAGWELVEIDCSEPPCVALLRGDPLQVDTVKTRLSDCEAWGAATPVVSSEVVDCPEGEPHAYHHLWFGEVPEGAFYQNLRRRLQARIVDLLQSNACRTP